MTALTTVVVGVASLLFERHAWTTRPPVASSISAMSTPVLGTSSGAFFLDEAVHWQDFAAMAPMVAAIAAVLLKPGGTGR